MEFLDDKAVVSSDEEMSDVDNADELDSPRKKKSSRKPKADTFEEDDDDDDDDEEEDDNQVVEGLIDDNPIDESDGEESVIGALKRKHESESEDDDNLDDDDYDLIEENLGTTIKRKHQRRRIENDEDEDDEEEINHGDKKKELEERLFDADGGGVEGSPVRRDVADDAVIAESDDEYEDEDDGFIVYDDEQQQRDVKKRRTHDDAAIQEAYDVFGAEFDFTDLDHAEDDEEEEEDADYEAEDGDEPEIRPTKSTKKKKASLKQIYEPGELERAHLTDYDQEIRTMDMPERFQLRSIAVCPTEEGELDEEAEWINKNAFNTPPLSKQDYYDVDVGYSGMHRKGPSTVNKIREALNLMRNQKFEVPFIAFYRKEYIDPELNITDLWKVFHWDEKWMQLKERKQNLLHLFEQLQQFQFEEASLDKPLDASFRRLTEDDIERVKAVQTMEQLNDIHQHFNLYYANDVTRMKMAKKIKRKLAEDGGEDGSAAHDEEASVLKQAPKRSAYNICVDAGLCEMARRFGLTPEQFGENINDNYMRHEVEQDPGDPNELAEEFIKGQFCSRDHVLAGSRHIVSMQIAYDPLVRSCVRQVFQERCKMNVRPTSKGFSEIDESHQCYSFKYLRSKPIRDLQEDQYLKIHQAEEDGLLKVDFFLDDKDNVRYTYYEEIKQLFIRDEYSHVVQEWNKQRTLAVERALNVILYPILIKQVKMKLLEEAKEHVMRVCCRKLYSCLKVAPYQVDQPLDEEDEDYDTSNGLRIMGVSFSDDKSEASYCAIIDGSGEVTDYLKLPYLATRRNSWIKDERVAKEKELVRLKDLILSKKPHVIAVGAESRDVLTVIDDLKNIVSELEQEQQIAPISIELIDNELARVYAASKKADRLVSMLIVVRSFKSDQEGSISQMVLNTVQSFFSLQIFWHIYNTFTGSAINKYALTYILTCEQRKLKV
ncbi:hypothetical protein HELRODRAFT_191379 [Helobdella robusta]|uniref:YqgF/RNase H-like domain-containing protein n=1 Tax=Helobdella robusta TaxID=6412 RepID=T1FSX9_HELRO|nr:hypothetical protein HELRODRAFT_191379 [Helobdella robusta]ESO05770.1 hypothetical protein HELRODRAFT_191379 [Helobdella robusta]